jgi:hypothetical protein
VVCISKQELPYISRTLGMVVSTINMILNDKECIKQHVKGSAFMKSTIITKQHTDVLILMHEIEKLLFGLKIKIKGK